MSKILHPCHVRDFQNKVLSSKLTNTKTLMQKRNVGNFIEITNICMSK